MERCGSWSDLVAPRSFAAGRFRAHRGTMAPRRRAGTQRMRTRQKRGTFREMSLRLPHKAEQPSSRLAFSWGPLPRE